MIPFFSWLSFAFDGIAIDRKRREHAVRAIEYARRSAAGGDVILISPEGTRSCSGQLLPFKKGVFHMWEQLQAPIIPMVIFGPHELRQSGVPWPRHGRIVVQFLAPIAPTEAASRDEMSSLLRRRMLEATMRAPWDTCAPESLSEWLFGLLTAIAIWAFHVKAVFLWLPAMVSALQVSPQYFFAMFSLASVIISICVYVYVVHIRTSSLKISR